MADQGTILQAMRLKFPAMRAFSSPRITTVESIMTRSILDEAHIHPAIRKAMADDHAEIISEVKAAIASNSVVVVGMAQNPFPRKARKALDAIGAPYKYLEYGSYLGQWRRRNSLKMWTGWPTFPMVFVNGLLVGGAADLRQLIDSGEFSRMVADKFMAPG